MNITGGDNLGLMEINDAISLIQDAAHQDANIIFGAVIDQGLGDEIQVTVVATGFDTEEERRAEVARVEAREPVAEVNAPAPPELPPLVAHASHANDEYETGRSPFVSVGAAKQPQRFDSFANAAATQPQQPRPWQTGGRSLSDITGSPRKRSPFSLPSESEFGPAAYPPPKKR